MGAASNKGRKQKQEMSSFLQLPELQGGSLFWNNFYLLTLSFSILFLLKWLLSSQINTQKNLPPSPPKLPLIGNILQLGSFPHRSLCSLARCHGQLMLIHMGSVPVLVASSASAAREIMKAHDLTFSSRPKSSINERLLYGFKDVASSPYGEYWRQMRSISVLHLLSNKRVDSFRAIRHEETALLIKNIERLSTATATEAAAKVNLTEMLVSLTNDVVCRAALGRKYREGKEGRAFKELLGEFIKLLGVINVGDFVPWLSWVNRVNGLDARVRKVFEGIDCFLEGVVEEHVERRDKKGHGGQDQKDLVDVLLEIQKENLVGFPLERVSIKALILDAFAAGTDTTFTVLEWAMTELLRHPEAMKKLQDEVRGISKCKKTGIVTEVELQKMHYLKAVIKETLRLHPPIPLLVPRESTQDVKLQGYDIAAGTMTFINVWAIGRDPASWEEPEEFQPERFLNNSIDFKGQDFQLIPFGAGRRGCPGIAFAMVTDELALANLVREFNWALPEGEELDMTESNGMTIHKKTPLLAVATPYPQD